MLEVVKWTPSGDNQTDTVGQTMPLVIRVKVTLDGAVTAGVTVNFSGANLGTTSMVTGSNGIATSTWTLEQTAGDQTATVTVDGAVGSPLTFHATAVPGPATALVLSGGNFQASDTNHIFKAPFAVRIVDAFSNGIPGRYVHWVKTGPVTLAADSIVTDDNGTSNMFVMAGATSGAVTLSASVTGLAGSPVGFTGAVDANPASVTIHNNFFSPDSIAIPAGGTVKWTWVGSGHSVAPTGANTFPASDVLNAGATFGPILFSTPGVYTYECGVHGAAMPGKIVVN
ncbi:MAG: cupredoxin domain-containing protein [Gemmatimonadetes bacterium]|nr:cupredoxin domain-containing protein [Gemmatimonadota bacterium]